MKKVSRVIEATYNRKVIVNNSTWRVSNPIKLSCDNIAGIYLNKGMHLIKYTVNRWINEQIEIAIFDRNQKFVQPFIINRHLLNTIENVEIKGKQLVFMKRESIIGICDNLQKFDPTKYNSSFKLILFQQI